MVCAMAANCSTSNGQINDPRDITTCCQANVTNPNECAKAADCTDPAGQINDPKNVTTCCEADATDPSMCAEGKIRISTIKNYVAKTKHDTGALLLELFQLPRSNY